MTFFMTSESLLSDRKLWSTASLEDWTLSLIAGLAGDLGGGFLSTEFLGEVRELLDGSKDFFGGSTDLLGDAWSYLPPLSGLLWIHSYIDFLKY